MEECLYPRSRHNFDKLALRSSRSPFISVRARLPRLQRAPSGRRQAARSKSLQTEDFRRGSYLLLSPGLVHVPMGDDEPDARHEMGYLWGLDVGRVRSFGPFLLGLGLGLEHAVFNYADDLPGGCGKAGGDCRYRGGLLRGQLHMRLGLAGQGFLPTACWCPACCSRINDCSSQRVQPSEIWDLDGGLELGLGPQIRVFRRFTIGFEPGIDFGKLSNHNDPQPDGYAFHTVDLEVLAGWYL